VDVERLIDDDHSARSIWETIGGLDLSLDIAKIAAVEGRAGRDHTAPQLLISLWLYAYSSLWLYAYSRGISSAREIARRCEFEPTFQWLCGLRPISHRTLSGFRSDNNDALGSVFVQVVGVLSAEGLITMERVTLDGTKIKANASGNTFRRKEKIEAHLAVLRPWAAANLARGLRNNQNENKTGTCVPGAAWTCICRVSAPSRPRDNTLSRVAA
jgi:transposase